MATHDAVDALATLKNLQSNNSLSIIKLSDQVACSAPLDSRQRASDVSNDPADHLTPSSLEADLTHYAELFAKLRFSYVEQVTKEKFIRAIVGEPPLIVTVQENLDLERANVEAKSQLRALKREVADMVTELETKGRQLSQRYERVGLETTQLEEIPAKIEKLKAQIKEIKKATETDGIDADFGLPLAQTRVLVTSRKEEQQKLAQQLEALRARVPRKRKEADRLRAELQPLEMKRQTSTVAARDAQKRKEAALDGAADDLEQRARWWRANEKVLQQVLNIRD
ncbi:hypothetical protein CDD82_7198 [Ophiocordyceps australis]|uniref:Kinetochore protein Sos7 coiled-coil domain-containing protein n=1 Tax=Ophiocordyceps australis TaxID=1399860 RepID=A0A2C5ZQF3_9HYPO|nr:hypothetical protein CDD82_7198 [Ophiocordyceps australis]